MGIEPTFSAWEADVLPLNYTRLFSGYSMARPDHIQYGYLPDSNHDMNILLNGEPFELDDNCTAARLLEQLELTRKKLALEINREIVPRSRFQEVRLHDGDRVEIVHAIGGG